MGLIPITSGGPGGMVYCAYLDSVSGVEHSVRFYVAPFTPVPSGLAGDYLYTGAGSLPPSETGILATVEAFGALWQQYYPNTWAFTLVAVAENQGGELHTLPLVPVIPPILGTASGTLPPGISYKRIFIIESVGDKRHWLVLHQMPGGVVDIGSAVNPTVGGLDARDRAFMAYISGSATGIVGKEGGKIDADATVLSWWDERRTATLQVPGPPGPPGPTGPAGSGDGGGGPALDCDPCSAITPVPTIDPQPGVPISSTMCGAAGEIAKFLEDYYAAISQWLHFAMGAALLWNVPSVVRGLSVILFTRFGLALTGFSLFWITQAARLIIASPLVPDTWPALTSDEDTLILKSVYCALPQGTPVGPIDQATKDEIVANLHAVESSFASLAGALVALLANVPSVAEYQALAYTGAQDSSPVCAGFTCGAHSFTGGAEFGLAVARSMTGGAQFGVHLVRSMTGGAEFGINAERSMTGGAVKT